MPSSPSLACPISSCRINRHHPPRRVLHLLTHPHTFNRSHEGGRRESCCQRGSLRPRYKEPTLKEAPLLLLWTVLHQLPPLSPIAPPPLPPPHHPPPPHLGKSLLAKRSLIRRHFIQEEWQSSSQRTSIESTKALSAVYPPLAPSVKRNSRLPRVYHVRRNLRRRCPRVPRGLAIQRLLRPQARWTLHHPRRRSFCVSYTCQNAFAGREPPADPFSAPLRQTSLVGTLFPIAARRVPRFKVPNFVWEFAKYFGAGV